MAQKYYPINVRLHTKELFKQYKEQNNYSSYDAALNDILMDKGQCEKRGFFKRLFGRK